MVAKMSNISSQSVREWLRAAANSFISQNYHHSRQQPLCQILWKKLFCLTFLKTNRDSKHPKEQEKVRNERKWGALTSIMRFAAVATLDWQNIYSFSKRPHHLSCTNKFACWFYLNWGAPCTIARRRVKVVVFIYYGIFRS